MSKTMNSIENKYYTPSSDEFHIGLEFELFPHEGDGWIKQTFTSDEQMHHYVSAVIQKTVRIKHIDDNDLLECGWFEWEHSVYTINPEKSNKDYRIMKHGIQYAGLRHFYNTNTFIINKGMAILFHGVLKNKSELSRVMTQIGITV